jgi:protein phosphatase
VGDDDDTDDTEAADTGDDEQPRERRVWRTVLAALVILVLVAAAGLWWVRTQYFIGVSDSGNIAVYRGIPGEMAGLSLAWLEIESDRPAADAVDDLRRDLDNGISADSIEDARDRLGDLTDPSTANRNLLPLCNQTADTGQGVSNTNCRLA